MSENKTWVKDFIIAVGWVSDLLEHEVSVWSVQNLFINVPIRTWSLTTSAWYMKQSKKGLYLSLKYVELRCKKKSALADILAY